MELIYKLMKIQVLIVAAHIKFHFYMVAKIMKPTIWNSPNRHSAMSVATGLH